MRYLQPQTSSKRGAVSLKQVTTEVNPPQDETFRKLGDLLLGSFTVKILLLRVLQSGSLFSETPEVPIPLLPTRFKRLEKSELLTSWEGLGSL